MVVAGICVTCLAWCLEHNYSLIDGLFKRKKKGGGGAQAVAQSSGGEYCPRPTIQNILSYPWSARPKDILAEVPHCLNCSQSCCLCPMTCSRPRGDSQKWNPAPDRFTLKPVELSHQWEGKCFMISQLTPVHSSSQVVLSLDRCVIYVRRVHLT